METLREGHEQSFPIIEQCKICYCVFKYEEYDIIKGIIAQPNQDYLYNYHFIFCPSCGVAINVPTVYSK